MTFIDLFAGAMLGHFVGDYLFQNQWMATRKSLPGMKGHIACTVHVLLYTLAVILFTMPLNIAHGTWWDIFHAPLIFVQYNPWLHFALIVAIPHWIIDRWSLATYWLRLKNGYWMKDTWEKAPVCATPPPDLLERNVWKTAFAAPVYIFNDNTLHWVCLWFTCQWFLR